LTLHLIEVRGKGEPLYLPPKRGQVSCELVRRAGDNPQEGMDSVGLNQMITVRAKLTDEQGRPLAHERVMFTYNTEWNLAKSAQTDEEGVAYQTLSTANKLTSSGFMGAESGRTDKASYYSVQVYYPGNREVQPSRNDCGLLVTNSTGSSDPLNTRLKVRNVDTSMANQTGKVRVRYQILDGENRVVADGEQDLGKAEGFYADDPNWQTLPVMWFSRDWHPAFNNVTVAGTGDPLPPNPEGLQVAE